MAKGNCAVRHHRRWWLGVAVLLVALLGACGSGGSSGGNGGGGGGGGGTRAKWTIILYIDADNNLQPYAFVNLDQLEQLPNNADVNLVCLMKCLTGFPSSSSNAPNARRFVIHHSSSRNAYISSRLPSEDANGHATDLGNLDVGQPATVRAFIDWAMANYPADHYAVDLWDHGSGWRPVGRHNRGGSRGILYSDTYPAYVHNEQMATALSSTSPIDLLMMDACNMQMAEVAYAVRNVCDIVVAGEDATPAEGYPYHRIFAPLMANADRTPAQLATDIVDNYATTTYANQVGFGLTQAALSTAALPQVASAIHTYAGLLTSKDGTFHNAIAAARTATISYDGGDPADYEGMRDLVDFCNRVGSATGDGQLITAGNAVASAVAAALLAERHVDSNAAGAAPEAGSHGLAIYLPSNNPGTNTDAWVLLRSAYRIQDFTTPSGWADWLDHFYGIPVP